MASKNKKSLFNYFIIFLYTISLAIFFYYLIHGWDYYTTPLTERPRHEAYRLLKPGGMTGHGFGMVGSAMILVMLLYSVRKRKRLFTRLGSIARWLDIHIYFGIIGPLFIILHSSFKVHGLVAISFYSMLAVALSGILGRYLYLQIPRNIRGHELTLEEIRQFDKSLAEQLEKYQVDKAILEKMDAGLEKEVAIHKSTIPFFITIFKNDFKRWIYRKELKSQLIDSGFPRKNLRPVMTLIKLKMKTSRRIIVLHKVQQIFHYWHTIHKPFAIVMIVIMFIHIAVAITFGYRWIF